MVMKIVAIKKRLVAGHFREALTEVDELLEEDEDNSNLWNLRGDLIQLLGSQDGPPLSEARKSYTKALELNPNDLEALESLARFHDVVEINRSKAKKFAKAYLERARKSVAEMELIIAGD